MKKLALSSILVVTLCHSEIIFSANINSNWTGFYLGANAGYWDSQSDVTSTGSVSFVNQSYELGASNIANALAQMATVSSSFNPYGFIGGGQAGYNYECNKVLLGLNIDFDGLTNSDNNLTLQNTANLVNYDENYFGTLAIKQKINYLGTVDARLGYLFYPTFLVYAKGGFAYGNVTLDTTWTAQESLGPETFPTVTAQNNLNDTLTGWNAGAGIEWFFKSHLSSMLEYTYYSLSDFNVSTTLAQTNASLSPPALWGSATANTAVSTSVWTIRVGLNYHFS